MSTTLYRSKTARVRWPLIRMTTDSGTVKVELVHHHDFGSISQAHATVVDFIENFYNPSRRHSALGYRSPIDSEQETRGTLSA